MFPYRRYGIIVAVVVDIAAIIISRCFSCRFVKPTQMSEQRVNEYIEGKYGKFGIDRYAIAVAILPQIYYFVL